MKNNNLTAAAAALTINTTVTAADLCTPAAPVIQIPSCIFAGGRCYQCDHYSGGYCYYHKSPVSPEKWSCSYFQ
ncbi:MAG: hypothetical protein IJZ02_01890 [Clostridia bacterium]|nr:hypothetical protein [Clostridia bacterium]